MPKLEGGPYSPSHFASFKENSSLPKTFSILSARFSKDLFKVIYPKINPISSAKFSDDLIFSHLP